MKISPKLIKNGIFITLGAIGGFAYYYFIGCYGGGCPIQSNPYISTIYGGLLGFVLSGIFTKEKKETPQKKSSDEM